MGSHRGQLTLKIDGLSTEVQVGGFSGHDGLSELFVYDVNISSEEPIDPNVVVGVNALLTLPGNETVQSVNHTPTSRKLKRQATPAPTFPEIVQLLRAGHELSESTPPAP